MNDEWKETILIGYYGILEDIKNWMKKNGTDCSKMIDQSFGTSEDISNIFFKIENKFTRIE